MKHLSNKTFVNFKQNLKMFKYLRFMKIHDGPDAHCVSPDVHDGPHNGPDTHHGLTFSFLSVSSLAFTLSSINTL